jgi:hypothetical protein
MVLKKDGHSEEKGCCWISKECGKMVKWACRLRNAWFFHSLWVRMMQLEGRDKGGWQLKTVGYLRRYFGFVYLEKARNESIWTN